MSFILGISTSSNKFEVVIGKNSTVLFNGQYNLLLNDTRDISFLVAEGIEKIGITLLDIKHIIVDIGPGGTSLVRTGVAFANGLAYSLGLPICPVMSLELLGLEAWEKFQLPIICTAKSINENAYIALYNNKIITLKYGVLNSVVQEIASELKEFVVVGAHREKILELFSNDKHVRDSGLQYGKTNFLIERHDLFKDRYTSFPNIITPITEQSKAIQL